MKRLNRKQKLIVAISIILIVIILVIVITNNVTNISQIANGGYFATTANSNSNLVASCIQKGITIGGVTGTLEVLDTSDATATPEDIAAGKTAYVDGVKITGTYYNDNSTLAKLKKTGQAVTENTTVEDRYNNQIKIPEGFKIADDSPITIPEGIVIEDVSANGATTDTKGSQFVWIPVGDVYTSSEHTEANKKTITLGRYTFSSLDGAEKLEQSAENWNQEVTILSNYKELATSSYGNSTAKSLSDFISTATTNHGYYIGRYEAGDALATTTARTSSTSDSNPLVCKPGVYPYTYIQQSKASSLSQGMYSSSNFDSDLINSYAWDTAIVFIQTFSGDTNYSRQKGKNTESKLQKCGESIFYANYVNSGDEAQDVRCNIYDMAGNTFEWSTETKTNSTPRTIRGGLFNATSGPSSRNGLTTDGNANCSFRIILYL